MASIASHRRVLIVWLGLALVTLLSWELGSGGATPGAAGQRLVVASVIVLAFLKVRFVGVHFMDLRRAPWGLRLAFDAWVLCVGGVMLWLAVWYRG